MSGTLLLVGAAGEPETPAIVGALAPSHDRVVAIDGGLHACILAGVVADMVVGDLDSASAQDMQYAKQHSIKTVRFPAEKDETDLDLALAEAVSLGAQEVTVTGVVGGRADHTLAALGSVVRTPALRVALVEPGLAGWVVRSGEVLELSGAGSVVSLLALPSDAVVSVRGAKWGLERHRLACTASLGMSNVLADEKMAITVHDGVMCVFSPKAEGYKPAQYVSRKSSRRAVRP
ncbi:MAG: thiamine diphosphokinase [Coriobacteriia bacterium]|nr:thiamine diphosphokinase [Coriobacteriia bacterium]